MISFPCSMLLFVCSPVASHYAAGFFSTPENRSVDHLFIRLGAVAGFVGVALAGWACLALAEGRA